MKSQPTTQHANGFEPKDNGIAAAILAGLDLARADTRTTEIAGIPVAITPADMKVQALASVLDEAERRAPAPKRRKGSAAHLELESFIAHVNRFKDADSAIFADTSRVQLIAVLDYHRAGAEGDPRWGEHRSLYSCPLSREWKLWTGKNDCEMSQDAFAEFIDANTKDIANPDAAGAIETDIASPAAVLQMARNLQVHTKGEFSRIVNATTGESSLVCKTENEPSSTKIPRAFNLGIPVFEGGAAYRIEARVRFRMKDGRPTFAFSLHQTDAILRDAFGDVRKQVLEGTGLPVFVGSPE